MCAMNRYQDTQNRAANQNIGQTTKRDGSFAGRKAKIGKKIQQKSGHGGSPGSKKILLHFWIDLAELITAVKSVLKNSYSLIFGQGKRKKIL